MANSRRLAVLYLIAVIGCGQATHLDGESQAGEVAAGEPGHAAAGTAPSAGTGQTGGAGGGGSAGTTAGTAQAGTGAAGAGTGAAVDPKLPQSEAIGELQSLLDDAAALDASGLADRYAVNFEPTLGYDPLTAQGVDRLQASNLTLMDDERARLQEHGFAILKRHAFPSFFYAYLTIYGEDLPVFVSADSILDAVHRSYDDILADLERSVMYPELSSLLIQMRSALPSLSDEAAKDAELFLAVAQALLDGDVPDDLSAGVTEAEVGEFVAAAEAANGIKIKELFGAPRRFDFSQFKPRGHYEGDERLEPFFRAMMWLGRIDFRLLETRDDGQQVLHRRQLEAALLLKELMDDQSRARWDRLDAIVSAFVGEHDYMILPELDGLTADLGIPGRAELEGVDDQTLAQAIVEGGYGAQRIASHAMVNGGGVATLPLSRSFAFFGQRYTVDSHVFSNVVYDRAGNGSVRRWLPNPLDAAFAALGNDQAVELLADELAQHPYAPDLAQMRALVDAHPPTYWEGSLYTLWLSSLRALSPAAVAASDNADGRPSVALTRAWGKRLLNTQLGSWSQLRHDTLLYVKQSYTVGTVCEFPDAYVDPYPEVFEAIGRFAAKGHTLVGELEFPSTALPVQERMRSYFVALGEVVSTLQAMAEHQRTGMPHSDEHLAFVNDVVHLEEIGSGAPSAYGWYVRLFYSGRRALEYDPIIADVHTDVGGVERPASVLHVATGQPRAMVVSIDTCVGPRLYAGAAFAYHEKAVQGLTRMTDSEWKAELEAAPAQDVPWMGDLIVP